MIKIVRAEYLGEWKIRLEFSDGSHGAYDAESLLGNAGSLVQPLRDPDFFRTFHLELGALCWPHGLELSPSALQQELAAKGQLQTGRKAA